MSGKGQTVGPPRTGFTAFIRWDYPFIIGLGTAGAFLALGNGMLENVERPFVLAAVFLCLFIAVLWSAFSVVRHADCLAVKCGEPYGTLILTLSAITIEVMMISAAMLHGANNPTLARDMMFAVIMITLNVIIGMVTERPVTLGIEGGNLPLLLLTVAVSVVTFGSGKTSVLQGSIHLLLFAVFLLLIFCP